MNGWPLSNGPVQGSLVDRWTVPHMLVGAGCSLLGLKWQGALIVAMGWELLENLAIIPRTHWSDETFLNTMGDIGANMAGFYLTEKAL